MDQREVVYMAWLSSSLSKHYITLLGISRSTTLVHTEYLNQWMDAMRMKSTDFGDPLTCPWCQRMNPIDF